MTIRDRLISMSPLLLGVVLMACLTAVTGDFWLPIVCGIVYAIGIVAVWRIR